MWVQSQPLSTLQNYIKANKLEELSDNLVLNGVQTMVACVRRIFVMRKETDNLMSVETTVVEIPVQAKVYHGKQNFSTQMRHSRIDASCQTELETKQDDLGVVEDCW